MIALLNGVVARRDASSVILDCGGVGYLVWASAQTMSQVPPEGSNCMLHTHLVVRDDSMTVFGFATVEERELFLLLTGVPSVGPKLALAVVGSAGVDVLIASIADGDAPRLQSVPGVGKRTAERICLDLKDTLGAFGTRGSTGGASPRGEARDALLALGMAEREIEDLLDLAEGDTAEAMIQSALRLAKK